jgi:hypothetical protein
MLGPDEINEIARLKRLMPASAERDYLQELLLFSIYSKVGPELVFKGGTCLYKLYKLSRFSEDLDFTLTKRIDIDEAVKEAIRKLRFLGVSGHVKEVKKSSREINFRLLFRGPLYRGGRQGLCFIPLNINLRERVILPPERAAISPIYREIPSFTVFSMRAEEILAEKVRAILTRDKPRDIYDLWFLLEKGIQPDLKLVNRKIAAHRMRFNPEKFAKRIDEMAKLWRIDLKNLVIGDLPEFELVKSVLIEKIYE